MGEQNMLRIEQVDVKGHNAAWAILSIDRQKQRNALNTELLGQIADALQDLAQSSQVRAVLICGEGEHFAAGADINEIKDKAGTKAISTHAKSTGRAFGIVPCRWWQLWMAFAWAVALNWR